ncbi:MAG: TetR/AcrR family transcriptional regulator [Anaerolineales bacterium]|jgi:AcrR family transcriptional regulator
MPRVVIEKEYTVKHNEILEAAQRLVYTTGYEQMSIQDILDELAISKGAFYHYFKSKQALLDGLVERMLDDAEGVLQPIAQASDLPAIQKLQRYFAAGSRWKTDRKSLMLNLLRIWYTDSNALVRQKQQAAAMQRIAPVLAQIVRQGIAEGVFTTTYPDQIGNMIWGVAQGIADDVAALLLTDPPPSDALPRLEAIVGAYSEALERILGTPAGSLPLVDIDLLKEWLPAPARKRKELK